MGFGWDHSYRRRLVPATDGTRAQLYIGGDGTTVRFDARTDGTFQPPLGVRMQLRRELDGSWFLTDRGADVLMRFDAGGLIKSMTDSGGVGLTFVHEGSRLIRVVDAEGREIQYEYANGRLGRVFETTTGVQASYTYVNDHLDSATDAAGKMESYQYTSDTIPPVVQGDYIPEPFLQRSCRAQCRASCPNPLDVTTRDTWCTGQRTRCESSCRAQCPQLCRRECVDRCDRRLPWGSDCGQFCAMQTDADFQAICQRSAAQTCAEECNRNRLVHACRGKTIGMCNETPEPDPECRTNPLRVEEAYAQFCADCFHAGVGCNPQSCNGGVSCAATCQNLILTGRAAGSTCQESRFAWEDGCATTMKKQCVATCQRADYCSSLACGGEFADNHPCVSQCRSSTCVQTCAISNCAVAAQDCPTTCLASCLEQGRRVVVPRDPNSSQVGTPQRVLLYGLPRDYANNLTHVYRGHYNGGGELYLENKYGPDLNRPSFDAVIEQKLAGHARSVFFAYDDTEYEGDFTSGLPFDPVRICPRRPFVGVFGPPAPADRGTGVRAVRRTIVFDPYGVEWTYYFGERGELLRSQNASTGAIRSFEYDVHGLLSGIEEPLRGRTCIDNDPDGNPIRIFRMPAPGAPRLVDFIRQDFTYQKFANGLSRLEMVSDPREPNPLAPKTLVQYRWDQSAYLMHLLDAEKFVTTFVPGPGGLPTQEVRPDQSIVRHQYTRGVRSSTVIDVTGPAPVTITLDPDDAGRPRRGTGPFGEETEWIWEPGLDRLSDVIRRNEAKTETISHKYNAFGQLRETSNGKRRTVYTYDPQGLLRRVSDFSLDRSVPSITPADMLDPSLVVDGGAMPVRVACTKFGPNGRYLETVLPDGNRLVFSYDGEGRVIRIEGGNLTSDGTGWDRGCPVFTGKFPAGGVLRSTDYDLDGRPLVLRDGRGKATTVVYDGFGNPATVTDPAGTVTRSGFDRMGNVVWSAIYAPGQAPADYRPPAESDPGLLAARDVEYDAAGRVKVIRQWHLDKDRKRLGNDGRAITSVFYDTARRRRLVTDDRDQTTIFEFDGAGRPVRTEHPTRGVETLDYSVNSRSVRITTTAPTATGKTVNLLRLTSWGAPAMLVRNFSSRGRPPASADELTRRLVEAVDGLMPSMDQAWGYDEILSRVVDRLVIKRRSFGACPWC